MLDLEHNNFHGTISGSLYALVSLTDLRLGFNELSGTISQNLGGLSNLRKYKLKTVGYIHYSYYM
jgi:hypothetical protein